MRQGAGLTPIGLGNPETIPIAAISKRDETGRRLSPLHTEALDLPPVPSGTRGSNDGTTVHIEPLTHKDARIVHRTQKPVFIAENLAILPESVR